jgi:5'(3')-deoxyribonucleotidase
MSQIKNIFIDMDGVLTNCHWAALYHHGVYIGDWPVGKWTGQLAETKIDKFDWNDFDFAFWANLQKTSLCDDLIHAAHGLAGSPYVFLLSRPTRNPQSYSGKMTWVLKNLPEWIHGNLILTEHKELLANSHSLLIDDNPNNCQKFRDNGGLTIPVYRPWNLGELSDSHVLTALKLYFQWEQFVFYCKNEIPDYKSEEFVTIGEAFLARSAQRKILLEE